MALHRFVFRLVAAVGIAAVAMAQSTTTTRETYFPATGLGDSEAMRVNVTNIATTPANGPAALCAGSISFIDASGNPIGAPTSFNVASGETFSAKLMPSPATWKMGPMPAIRSVVDLTITPGSAVPCVLITSMEKYDMNTGVTHLFVSGETMPRGLIGFGRLRAATH